MPIRNLPEYFLANVDRLRARPCWRYKKGGAWKTVTWEEAEDLVWKASLGLSRLGIGSGDRVAILSSTRYEWTVADLAVLCLGAITVPIYPSSTPEQTAYILKNSGAKAVFVEDAEQWKKILNYKKKLPSLKKIISFSESKIPGVIGFKRLKGLAPENQKETWLEGVHSIEPTQTATIVYTSGTTGPPKGVVLTHANFIADHDYLVETFTLNQRHIALIFLPLAHIFARAVQFWQLAAGFVHCYGHLDTVLEDLHDTRPNMSASVPRVFEKMREKILARLQASPWIARKAMVSFPVAQLWFHRKIRELFGGRLHFIISGGAPLSPEVAQFFHDAGVKIMEGYGLTETTAGIFINTLRKCCVGTVGRCFTNARVKIARDGEILLKGPMVFKEYYKDPQATRQAFTRDGWFKTGDLGTLDRDGFLTITGRKKDLIITSAGKNIAPQNIENLMKSIPYLSHVMVHGDRRHYLTALVTLNEEAVTKYAQVRRLLLNGYRTYADHPEIHRLVQKSIEAKNQELASYETIKKFAILKKDFSQAGGELTPTLKVKRNVVGEKYKDLIDQLYQ